MAAKFGTSGLRGLVSELGPEPVARHLRAFIAACDLGEGLCVGRDLRPSSPAIAAEVIAAARGMGVRVLDCGALPTPALALRAGQRGMGAVMVTGSHIPADRNGLKFYSRRGEITKADEAAILAALDTPPRGLAGALEPVRDAGAAYVARYVAACGHQALAGRRLGLYSHSAVARDLMAAALRGMGAEVLEFGRSENFIPVDTEAVDPAVARQIWGWVQEHRLDALVSTDGDSDRPLLADEAGRIVPGDLLGQITARGLGAHCVVTPVSSNSGVLQAGFARVIRTRIGSPYVIAAMEAALEAAGEDTAGTKAAAARVVGYEANGGFLLGFAARGPAGPLAALPTRDSLLPLVMVLLAAGDGPVSAVVAREPAVVTRADRLTEIAPERGQAYLAGLAADPAARAALLAALQGELAAAGATVGAAEGAAPLREAALDLTDGLRLALAGGAVVHLRPSGNAPEFRLYVEAAGPRAAAEAEALLAAGLRVLARALRPA